MAATTGGALKALIEGAGLGLSAYRDAAPSREDVNGKRVPTVPYPYCTIAEGISLVPNLDGDFGDPARKLTGRELASVDLWQRWRDPATGKPAEDYTLPSRLLLALHGARTVLVGTSVVYGVVVASWVRLLEEESNLVHHAITCTVHRAV